MTRLEYIAHITAGIIDKADAARIGETNVFGEATTAAELLSSIRADAEEIKRVTAWTDAQWTDYTTRNDD